MLLTDDKDLASKRRASIMAGLEGEKDAKEEFDKPEETEDDEEEEEEDEEEEDEFDEDVISNCFFHAFKIFPIVFLTTDKVFF